MGYTYLNPLDYIKKRPFELLVPAFYHPHMPKHVVEPEKFVRKPPNRFKMVAVNGRSPLPYYSPADPDQLESAAYSIEVMIEMVHKKVEFQLRKEDDIIEIFEQTDRYLMFIKDKVEKGDVDHVEYCRKVHAFREHTYKHFFRYMKMRPGLYERMYRPGNRPGEIIDILARFGAPMEGVKSPDPLKALMDPPYPLPKPKVDHKANAVDFNHQLGIPVEQAPSVPDAAAFDYEAFLKGGK